MTVRIMPFATAVMLALVLACANKESMLMNRKQDLVETVKSYNEHLGWRDFESASTYVIQEQRPDFLRWAAPLKRGFTLESFTVIKVELSPSEERAAVVVERSYILAPSVTLRSEKFTQEWVQREGDWYLAGPPY